MQLDAVFRSFDEDGDGKVSAAELVRGTSAVFDEELSLDDAAAVLEMVDADGDGLLNLQEFMKLALETEEEEEEEEEERSRYLRAAFEMFENDGEGCITARSLKRMLSRLGMSPRDVDDCRVMIDRFDLNGDGVLTFDEFTKMMLV